MNLHSRARSCPFSRGLFVERVFSGMTVLEASRLAGFSERTGHKWLRRFREEGTSGLCDRTSRPRCLARSHELGLVVEAVGRRRRGQAAIRIAADLGVPRSTVGFWLRKAGISQPSALQPKEPDNRYEHAAPVSALYSLELNPTERIWKTLREGWFANTVINKDMRTVERALCEGLRGLEFDHESDPPCFSGPPLKLAFRPSEVSSAGWADIGSGC